MTNDYKSNLLKWLVGKYSTQNKVDVPQFSSDYKKTNNLQNELHHAFPNGYFINGSFQGQDTNNNGIGYSVIFGSYAVDSSASAYKGFIISLNQEFNILQIFKTYASGTELGEINALNVGDDGQFFLIETQSSGVKRFVMVNNFLIKKPTDAEYSLTLRKSYNLQGNANLIQSYSNIIKSPGQSHYLIVGIYLQPNSQMPMATDLEIKVGEPNVWTDYTTPSGVVNNYSIGDTFANWDSDGNINFKVATFAILDNTTIRFSELVGNSKTEPGVLNPVNYGAVINNASSHSVKIIDFYTSYYSVVFLDEVSTTSEYHKVVSSGSDIDDTLLISYPISTNYKLEASLYKINKEVFYFQYNLAQNENWDSFFYVGRITPESVYEASYFEEIDTSGFNLFIPQKQYNLYNFYAQIGNTLHQVQQLYNENDYNGKAYIDYNSMVGKMGVLYDDNLVIFARNLYNKYVNNNTTLNVLEVPNTFINDLTIKNQKLFSQANNIMLENASNLTKNIYETLYLNFYNKLLISNENDSSNVVINQNASNYLNSNIDGGAETNYQNSKARKLKINYEDNSNKVRVLVDSEIEIITDTTAMYDFAIYVDKKINSIEIISNDEAISYQVIDVTNLDVGKIYNIIQMVEVI